jgi:phosphate-selective porin
MLFSASPAVAQEPAPFIRVRFDDRPSIRFGKVARIDFRARFQADDRSSEVPLASDEAHLSWTRRRIGVEGELAGIIGFEIEREVAEDRRWADVFVNYQQFDFVQVQAGRFKLPFSLDETTSIASLDFVYRSRAADLLAPGRDRGVMVHGRLARRMFTYEAGVFEHDGDNARKPNSSRVSGGRAVAARLSARPFRGSASIARTLEAGVALVNGEVELGFPALEGETVFGREFFEPDIWVMGKQQRRGVEFRWRPGPFSLKSEYIRMTTERRGQSVQDEDLSPYLAVGWYASGTWAVTGERKADGLDRPLRPITHGGPGAIELAARLESLRFGSTAHDDLPSTSPRADVVLGNELRAVTLGVNWHPMRWIKLQFNFIRESLGDPEQGPLPGQRAFWSRVFRVQFVL